MKEVALKFNKISKRIKNIDYFLYMLYPLMKDKKLIQKIYVDLETICREIIEVLLLYEYKYKRISNYKFNLDIFSKVAKRFEINDDEITTIKSIIKKGEEIKKSAIDFIRKDKYIILKDGEHFVITDKEIKDAVKKIKLIYLKMKKNFEKDLLISKYL